AVLLGGATVSRRHQRADILQSWPQAAGTVTHCSLEVESALRRNTRADSWWVVCDIMLAVKGQSFASHTVSAPRESGRGGVAYTVDRGSISEVKPEQILRAWIRQHPHGSTVDIRYNPAKPTETSFVGCDQVLDVNPVPSSLIGVVLFAAISTFCGVLVRFGGRAAHGPSPL
ncbi:MAG TPA: DUF3592 domain-containing protein, partial [Gemmatimonadaceae bacterium]|nr:DUF3592 domain-containing protein [Gemmatimonadaceae bacterium]